MHLATGTERTTAEEIEPYRRSDTRRRKGTRFSAIVEHQKMKHS
jgi:hypothetical protein